MFNKNEEKIDFLRYSYKKQNPKTNYIEKKIGKMKNILFREKLL